MDTVNITEINYKEYGKCLRVTNDIIEVIVSIQYGPRIIKYGYVNDINHFAEGIEDKVVTENGDYYIIGGHKFLYLSENENNVYVPDNKKVQYESIENGIRFIQETEERTYLQKIIEIVFEGDAKLKVLHKIVSTNPFDVNVSMSAITTMNNNGIELIPLEKSQGNAPDKSFVFWPYSNLKDPRVYFGDKYIAMKVNENVYENFRIGFNMKLTRALYYSRNQLFVKEVQEEKSLEKCSSYPNMGSKYESFISKNYIEMQTNSPKHLLKSNGCIEHLEIWNLYKEVSLDFIDKFIN